MMSPLVGGSGDDYGLTLFLGGIILAMAWAIPWGLWHSLLSALLIGPTIFYRLAAILLASYGLGSLHALRLSVGVIGLSRLKNLKLVVRLRSVHLRRKILGAIKKAVGRRLPIDINQASFDMIAISISLDDVSLGRGKARVVGDGYWC